jgi:hypothetical protein
MLLLPGPCLFGQWINRLYDYNLQTELGGVVLDADTGLILFAGIYADPIYRSHIQMLRTDSLGNVVYEKEVIKGAYNRYEFGWSSSGVYTQDGNIALGISHVDSANTTATSMLIKINQVGDTLWTREYGSPGQWQPCYSMAACSDGGFILVGYFMHSAMNYDIRLIRTDSLGNVLWAQNYGTANRELGSSVIQTSDGGFLVGAGRCVLCNGDDSDGYLLKVNAAGVQQWARILGNPAESESVIFVGHEFPDGTYLVGGMYNYGFPDAAFPTVYKINAAGTVLWRKDIPPGFDNDNAVQSISTVNDTMVLVSGLTKLPFPDYGSMFTCFVDSSGAISFYRRNKQVFEDDHYQIVYQTILCHDGRIAFTGYATNNGEQDMWYGKLDEEGCLREDCWVEGLYEMELNNPSLGLLEKEHTLGIYPNPAQTQCYLLREESDIARVEVYGMDGRLIYQSQVQGNVCVLDVQSWSKGMYEIRLYSANTFRRGRLVVE